MLDVDCVSGFWRRLEVGCAAEVSEEHAILITRVEVKSVQSENHFTADCSPSVILDSLPYFNVFSLTVTDVVRQHLSI
jgi:hypothetical protein